MSMNCRKVTILIIIILAFSWHVIASATELTDNFVKDTLDGNPWNEPNVYVPQPILFVHGTGSHCITWGGPEDEDRITINTLKKCFSAYKEYDGFTTNKLTLSQPSGGRTEVYTYSRIYMETVEFSYNNDHPKNQAKELAYRIFGSISGIPSSWPKPMDITQNGFQPIMEEYYGNNPANWKSSDKFILVAHSLGGLSSREYLTSPEIGNAIGIDRHISKLILVGASNLGTPLANIGHEVSLCTFSSLRGNARGETKITDYLSAAEGVRQILKKVVNVDINSPAVEAQDPFGDYLPELNARKMPADVDIKTVCGIFDRYKLVKIAAKIFNYKTSSNRKSLGMLPTGPIPTPITMIAGIALDKLGDWLSESDGVIPLKSQQYLITNGGQIPENKSIMFKGMTFHTSEPTRDDELLAAIDDMPLLKVISPLDNQQVIGNSFLVEGKFYDYLPASAVIKVYAGIKEIGLASDKSSKPIDVTKTTITENGKYNAGFSFDVNSNEIGTATFIVITITNPGANKTSQVVLININPPAQTQIYYRHKDGSQQLVPKGTQVVLTKIFPNGALEEYVEQTLVGDNGWIKFNHIPTLNEYGKSNLRYRIIVDSINKEPNSQMPRSTVTVGETGNMYRLISPVVYFKRGDFDEDGTIDEGYRTVYPDSSVREVVIEEDSVGVVTSGYLTTQSYEFGVPFSGVITYHNKPQVGNILKSLNKAHLFLANYDQSSKVLSCGYSKDKNLTLTGNAYYGYNASYTKKRLFINSVNEEEWNQDAILQAFGNMLSNRYFRLGQNYFPQWGANTTSEQALVNGWSQYFNAMSADSKKIKINGIERDLGSPLIAKGIANEQAIAGALAETERFDLIWPKVMENFNAGKSILNINDLFEVIKDQNFSPKDIGQIFIKYGLKPKLVSVNNTTTTRPIFTWNKNDTLGVVDKWEINVAGDQELQNIIFTKSGVAGESLDLNSVTDPAIPSGLGEGQYFWRVKANTPEIDNFYSLTGQFNINLSYTSITSAGGSVPISGGGSSTTTPVIKKAARSSQSLVSGNVPGTLEIPAGAVNGEVKINVTPMTTAEKLGDYIVLGQKLYEIYPNEYAFLKPCSIKFNLGAFTEVNGYGIYRYNFQTKEWDFVGADYDPNTKVMSANTSQLGIYGVLRDTKAPGITNIVDSPDPFSPNADGANDTTTFNYELNKACNVSIHIVGGNTDVTLNGGLQKTRMNQTIWDGKDNQGQAIPDGKYSYTITATDLLGGQTSATGTIFVFTQQPGTVKGHVLCNGQNVYDARIRMVGSTLETRTDASGNFALTDVPPSTISPEEKQWGQPLKLETT